MVTDADGKTVSTIVKELFTSWWGLVLVACVVIGLLVADQLGLPPVAALPVAWVSFRAVAELAGRAGWSKPPGHR